MITPTKAYTTSDGKTHGSLPEAQAAELVLLISRCIPLNREFIKSAGSPDLLTPIVSALVENAPEVVAILSAKERKRLPKNQGKNGKRCRVPKTPAYVPREDGSVVSALPGQ